MSTQPPLRPRIFEAVEALRQRKCRPDRESIAHYILRKYGVKFLEVFNELESVVDEELLIKVEYKGSISYRLPSQFGKPDTRSSPLLTKHSKILNSVQTTRCIITALNELLSQNESYNVDGIPFNELKTHLQITQPERFKDLRAAIAIERELFSKSGNLFKSPKGRLFPKDIPIPSEEEDDEDSAAVPASGAKKPVGKKRGRKPKKVAEEETEESPDKTPVLKLVVPPEPEDEEDEEKESEPQKPTRGRKRKTESEEIIPKKETKTRVMTTRKRARRGGLDETRQCLKCRKDLIGLEDDEDDVCSNCIRLAEEEEDVKPNTKKLPTDPATPSTSTSSPTETEGTLEIEEAKSKLSDNPSKWTSSEVETFFQCKGLKEEGALFKEQEIDGLSLLLMRRKDVIQGIPKLLLGPALKVHRLIRELQVIKKE